MSNPDGMLSVHSPVFSTSMTNVALQRSPNQAATSTSVKDLIDLAIEDALGSNTTNGPSKPGKWVVD